jgi:hypothetical protein
MLYFPNEQASISEVTPSLVIGKLMSNESLRAPDLSNDLESLLFIAFMISF